MTDSIARRAAPGRRTKPGSTARGNIFGVNLSARILQGRWEICHCTQAYAGTWNFMRCSVSINPSLQRALRPRFVLGACQADIYVPASPAYICTRSLAVLFSITSIPAPAPSPILLPHDMRLSRLRPSDTWSLFFPPPPNFTSYMWYHSRDNVLRVFYWQAGQRMRSFELHNSNTCDISLYSVYRCFPAVTHLSLQRKSRVAQFLWSYFEWSIKCRCIPYSCSKIFSFILVSFYLRSIAIFFYNHHSFFRSRMKFLTAINFFSIDSNCLSFCVK
jgi:hypothetical protein